MSVGKDEAMGTWTIYSRYTNWQNKTKVLRKRGFKTKREALEYERKFLLQKFNSIWDLRNLWRLILMISDQE